MGDIKSNILYVGSSISDITEIKRLSTNASWICGKRYKRAGLSPSGASHFNVTSNGIIFI